MFVEVCLFRSLFRNTGFGETSAGPDGFQGLIFPERKALWLGAMALHWSLLVIVVRHLRLFVDPIPRVVVSLAALDGFFDVGSPTWYATDVVVVVALGYLLVRRLRDPLLRYLTLPADYLALACTDGRGRQRHRAALRGAGRRLAVRAYALGLAAFAPAPLPATGAWLAAHLLSVSFLLAILPFTKMVHAAGVWLSPTRNRRTTAADGVT